MAASTPAMRLAKVWESPNVFSSIFGTVDHKQIGLRYIATALVFFAEAGAAGLMMRIQLAWPNLKWVAPDHYDQIFSLHGTVMIFLVATPIVTGGFGNYLVPLMIGTRDMAFPRLNAFGYWVYLFAGMFIYSSFFASGAPNGGWFAYTPLTTKQYLPDTNMDFWGLGLVFLGISTTAGAINFIVTIFKLRAPGMSINRMPLFVWGILAASFAIIFAFPSLTIAAALLELDRIFGTQFFNPNAGGSSLLWQHLFWVFGHPEVYIIFLPSVGIVSTIVATFSQTRIAGYLFLVLATVAIGFVSFGVWVHHMFATGISPLSLNFFAAAGMAITIPSGIQIFAWIATIWKGKPVWKTPFLFIVGFLITIVMGGLTGVMVSIVPFDWQVTDSYFIVAHLHYVLIGGVIFPVFAALYYWLPKMTGRMMNEKLSQVHFWLFFIGFNLTFFPQHILGLIGMQRRVFTYPAEFDFTSLNLTSSIGAFIMASGLLVFLANLGKSVIDGPPAGKNPWNASTLEWATESPPEDFNFRDIPHVTSHDPLWDDPTVTRWDASLAEPSDEHHEVYMTSMHDPRIEHVISMPGDSYLPVMLALSILALFVGILLEEMWLIAAAGLAGLLIVGKWFWPEEEEEAAHGQ